MAFSSALFSIPPIYIILLVFVFFILLIEIIYLIKKKKGPLSTSDTTRSSAPITGNDTSAVPPPQQVLTPPEKGSRFPWKVIITLAVIAFLGTVVFIGAVFLKKPAPQQELRGRAAGNISVSSYTNNCNGASDPTNPACKGNVAWVDLILKNNGTADQNVEIRKQQFSCDIGVAGTRECGQNAHDNIYTVVIQAGKTLDLGKLQISTPQPSCGSAQTDYFFRTDSGTPWVTPYWGFAWTGTNCENPTPPPAATPTVAPSLTPTKTPIPTLSPTPSGLPITPSPTPGPTLTPIAAMCVNVKFYSVDLTANPPNLFLQQLSSSDLSNLSPGNKINITVMGNTGSDKGRIRVNGSLWQELTNKNPVGSNEFYDANPIDLYQIPTTGTTFTVEGQVHDSQGWH